MSKFQPNLAKRSQSYLIVS